MEFTKFPKMENLQVAMEARTEDFEQAAKLPTKWVVTEKIDGTNISLNITKDSFQFGSRNGLLSEGEEFYNVMDHRHLVSGLISKIASGLMEADLKKGKLFPGQYAPTQISLYGEFYGQRIMNRLHYGLDSKFRFYAALFYYGGGLKAWSAWCDFVAFMRSLEAEDMLVPLLAEGLTFEDACKYQNDCKSRLCNDVMEGVVIWPEMAVPFCDGRVLAFKNKNEQFRESTARKVHTPLTEAQQYAKDMNGAFLEYLNESRMWSVFSKLGKAEDDKRAGEYIKALLDDAWEDFRADNHDVELLDKPGIKVVRNGGSKPYTLFKLVQAKMGKEE